jgi:hypothetical protein
MSIVFFYAGGALLISGLWLGLQAYQSGLRIVKATSHEPDGLQRSDLLWNYRYFNKRRKLRALADGDGRYQVQADATRALRLETVSKLLYFAGMILMLIGASSNKL